MNNTDFTPYLADLSAEDQAKVLFHFERIEHMLPTFAELGIPIDVFLTELVDTVLNQPE